MNFNSYRLFDDLLPYFPDRSNHAYEIVEEIQAREPHITNSTHLNLIDGYSSSDNPPRACSHHWSEEHKNFSFEIIYSFDAEKNVIDVHALSYALPTESPTVP